MLRNSRIKNRTYSELYAYVLLRGIVFVGRQKIHLDSSGKVQESKHAKLKCFLYFRSHKNVGGLAKGCKQTRFQIIKLN